LRVVAGDLAGGLGGAGVGILRHDSGALMLELGSHDEELADEAAEAAHAGEVVGIGAAGSAVDLMCWAEERVAAVLSAGVSWGEECLLGGVVDGGGGLRVPTAVMDVVAGIGVEEGYDEEGGENLEGAARIVEARHSAGRGGAGGSGVHRVGRVGHGSFALGTASHGWVAAGAGSCEKYRGLCGCGCGCAFGRDDERLSCWMRCSRSRFPKGMTERKATAGAKAEATSEATAEAKAEAYSRRE